MILNGKRRGAIWRRFHSNPDLAFSCMSVQSNIISFALFRSQEDNSWMGYLSKAVSTTASYLPAQVTDTLNQTRAVATVTVPNSPVIAPNTVAIANISRQTRLLLASSDGYLYIYNLPGEQPVLPQSSGYVLNELAMANGHHFVYNALSMCRRRRWRMHPGEATSD